VTRPRYVPESDDLIAARRAEQASSVQTERERVSDHFDTIKDRYVITGGIPRDHPGARAAIQRWITDLRFTRRGVVESYSHLYDADSGSSAEVARKVAR